jgi:DNA-binding XRE family transcriptional regulator
MIIGGHDMQEFHPAKKRVEVSVGESVRILRELQELSQSQLSKLTGIPQATISAIENNWVNLDGWRTIWRAKVFARALKCRPEVLVFPSWGVSLKAEETTSHPTRQPKDGCQVVGYAA